MARGLTDPLEYQWMGVTNDHRAPGTKIVDVALTFNIGHVRPIGRRDKAWLTANGPKGPHRRIDAAHEHALCSFKFNCIGRHGNNIRIQRGKV
jgi:hypothetical protein